jgi:amidase/aspartyl-tRNA(Asn)/glutamyl-tRNA(Gln) amidotransferase subunit A
VPEDEAALAYAPATELAAAIRAREISPVDAVRAAAGRIEARNPTLNAFVHLALDEALDIRPWSGAYAVPAARSLT